MASFVFYPEWFLGIDHVFELISMIVGFLLSFFAYKAYRLTDQRNYKFFSAAFGLIGVSFIFKILSTLVTHRPFVGVVKGVPGVAVAIQALEKVGWAHIGSFLMHQWLMMLAFFILLVMAWRIKNKSIIILFCYLTAISVVLGLYYYHVMPFTLALLTGFTYNHYRIVSNKRKSKNSILVARAFLLLFLAQIILLFVKYRSLFYVAGEAIQLGGFLIFLWLYIKLLK